MPYAEDGIYTRKELIHHLKSMMLSWEEEGAVPFALNTVENIIELLEPIKMVCVECGAKLATFGGLMHCENKDCMMYKTVRSWEWYKLRLIEKRDSE